MWFVGVGLFAFIVICIFLYKIHTIVPPRKHDKHVNVSKVFEKAKNGDLIFTCGNTFGEKVIRYITGSEFSHIGILFWEIHPTTKKNILYIYDSDIGGDSKSGNRIMTLKRKLKHYKKIKIGGWRRIKTKQNLDIFEHVKKHINNTFNDTLFLDWFLPFKLSQNKNFCSELVAKVLSDFGILKTQRLYHNFSPGDFSDNLQNIYSSLITFDF